MFAFFIGSTVALTALGELYAILLRLVAYRFPTLRLPLGILLYLAFGVALLVPLGALQWIEQHSAHFGEFNHDVGMSAWLLSALAAVVVFYRRHYLSLKRLGYFQPRK
ncbi:hypothetical protein LP420_31900 [Massilia sp. B-10]|nr:hypothetical protein LP420_31900 [Massilia sp. B-10]UUZ53346.1 hypothetical protein LP419_31440 [Massilia sp. H-1]